MVQAKGLASLSSQLLARKGTARPAMRPQGFGGGFNPGIGVAPLEDLGWNDMGAPETAVPVTEAAPVPPVLVEREALKDQVEAPRAIKSISVATATRIGRESAKQTKTSKAAFTLRLDGDRHLRLRLASAVTNESSQVLVARALDLFLQSLPEVEALVAQLPVPKPATR